MSARATSLLSLIPALAWATSIVPHSLFDRARVSDRVAFVQVLDRWSELGADGRSVKTYTRVVVGEDVKGRGPSELTIVQMGGRSGPLEVRVPGDATFEPGETAVVFLACGQPQRCTLVALGEGKLAVHGGTVRYRDLLERVWVERPLAEVVAELKRPASVAPAGPVGQVLR